jgi:hypothetical protein
VNGKQERSGNEEACGLSLHSPGQTEENKKDFSKDGRRPADSNRVRICAM